MQSIPAVYAFKDRAVVDGFMGAYPEQAVKEFVDSLLPSDEEVAVSELIAAGDEDSLRMALAMEPANEDAIVALAELLIADGDTDEALALLGRIPESDRTAACRCARPCRRGTRRTTTTNSSPGCSIRSSTTTTARQKYVDLLELMGPTDPRTADYRRQLTSRLY